MDQNERQNCMIFLAIPNYFGAGSKKNHIDFGYFYLSWSIYTKRNFLKNQLILWYFCNQFMLIEIISNISRIKWDILAVKFYLYNVGSDFFGRTIHY